MSQIRPDGTHQTLKNISERLRQIREGKLVPASTEYERQGDRISVRIETGKKLTPTAIKKRSR
jgi:hypothetical protein